MDKGRVRQLTVTTAIHAPPGEPPNAQRLVLVRTTQDLAGFQATACGGDSTTNLDSEPREIQGPASPADGGVRSVSVWNLAGYSSVSDDGIVEEEGDGAFRPGACPLHEETPELSPSPGVLVGGLRVINRPGRGERPGRSGTAGHERNNRSWQP